METISNNLKARIFSQYVGQPFISGNVLDNELKETTLTYPDLVIVTNGWFNDATLSLKRLANITDEDAIEVAKIAFKRDLPYEFEFTEITRTKYNSQDGTDAEESINVRFTGKVTADAYKGVGWKDEKFMVQIVEYDRYSPLPHICCYKVGGEFQKYFWILRQLECFDYLRSKGYALPYMEYSVNQLVEMGVYKLII